MYLRMRDVYVSMYMYVGCVRMYVLTQ